MTVEGVVASVEFSAWEPGVAWLLRIEVECLSRGFVPVDPLGSFEPELAPGGRVNGASIGGFIFRGDQGEGISED